MNKNTLSIREYLVAALLIAATLPGFGETRSLLILHTNDLHARIRPARGGTGGMPYVSGYIHQVREQRKDVFVLDAGDVTEKGDMVSFMTHNTVMYEAMNAAGYDAAVPGNHDMRDPLYLEDGVKAAPNVSFVCMNCFREIPSRIKPSEIFTVNGIRVAVIGLTVKSGDEASTTLNDEDGMRRLVQEVGRLDPESDIQIVVCHLGSKECQEIAKRVPGVDLYVSGHTHELLHSPLHTDSGALIVQAGEYAEHVGRVDLQIDLDTHKVARADVSVAVMDQAVVPCDKELLGIIEERTRTACPEANRVITRCEEPTKRDLLGPLAAKALRLSARTDISLFNAPYIFRADLPKGDISIADIFLAGGFRGHKMVVASLTGKEIESYLTQRKKPDQSWDGFDAKVEYDQVQGKWSVKSSLDPERLYSVVIPVYEWQRQYLPQDEGAAEKTLQPCSFSFTDSVVDYITAHVPPETSLNAYLKSMPPNAGEKP